MAHYSEWASEHYGKSKQSSEFIRAAKKGEDVPKLLFDLLVRATPHGTEHHIVDLLPFKDKGTTDEYGNFIIRVGDSPTVMFSSHMDTVHTIPGKNEKKEYGVITPLVMNDDAPTPDMGFVWAGIPRLVKQEEGKKPKFMGYASTALGADDKVGVYTMCKMIEKGIEGLYVFHAGEEVGCVGSRKIVMHNPDLVKGIQSCIAFDRAGYTDVIAYQRSERCASDEFSNAIAEELNKRIKLPKQKFTGGVRGVFTDSAVYVDLIPECTNISVGYFNQHGGDEKFDLYWYEKFFLPAVLEVDWKGLPIERDPKAKKTYPYSNTHYYNRDGAYGTSSTWNGPKVKPGEVDDKTPLSRCPDWKPEDGYLEEASIEGMARIMYNWMTGMDKQQRLCKMLATLMVENKQLQEENDELLDEIDKATNPGHYEEFDPAEDTEAEQAVEAVENNSLEADPNSTEQLLLPAPAADEGKEGKESAGDKMHLLTSFFSCIGQVPFGQKEKNKLVNFRNQYDKMCRRILRTKKTSDADFRNMNVLLYEVSGIFLQRAGERREGIVYELLRDSFKHMWDHREQPGLENVREEV